MSSKKQAFKPNRSCKRAGARGGVAAAPSRKIEVGQIINVSWAKR
jgi:hypothetical protein